MTQLTDKLEGLRLKQGEAVPFQAIHFNEAIDKCIALVKAEAAVAGDWEAEIEKYKEPTELNGTVYYRLPINKLTHLLTAEREAMRQETMRTVMAHCRKLVDKPEEAIYLGQIEEMLYELDQEYLTPPTK